MYRSSSFVRLSKGYHEEQQLSQHHAIAIKSKTPSMLKWSEQGFCFEKLKWRKQFYTGEVKVRKRFRNKIRDPSSSKRVLSLAYTPSIDVLQGHGCIGARQDWPSSIPEWLVASALAHRWGDTSWAAPLWSPHFLCRKSSLGENVCDKQVLSDRLQSIQTLRTVSLCHALFSADKCSKREGNAGKNFDVRYTQHTLSNPTSSAAVSMCSVCCGVQEKIHTLI